MLMDPSTPEFTSKLLQSLVEGTRASNEVPAADDHSFACTYPAYAAAMDGLSSRITGMLQGFVQQQRSAADFGGMDDVDDRFETLTDLSDKLLEQVDANLDAARKVSNALEQPASSKQQQPGSAQQHVVRQDKSKPQSQWPDEVHNSDEPFVPKLRSKPNAVAPLALTLVHSEEVSRSEGRTASWPPTWYANPYAAELDAFAPSEAQLTPPAKQRLFPPVHTTPCTWVATEAALHRLVATLGGADELALDLEHHSHRSYRGITCLMQLSTREEVRPQTTKRAQQRRGRGRGRGGSLPLTRALGTDNGDRTSWWTRWRCASSCTCSTTSSPTRASPR